jgi:hypothetical protein
MYKVIDSPQLSEYSVSSKALKNLDKSHLADNLKKRPQSPDTPATIGSNTTQASTTDTSFCVACQKFLPRNSNLFDHQHEKHPDMDLH